MAQLPQQPNDPCVTLPADPANPPTLADLHNAHKYKQNVLASAGSHHVFSSTSDDIGCAMTYEHSLTHIVSAAVIGPAIAPPWFVAAFAPVQQQLNRMERGISKIANAANGDGSIYEYQIVPFVDGTDPTGPPHNLPPLTSAAVIDMLSTANVQRYLVGYGVQNIPGSVHQQHRLVKLAIGCRAA